MTLSKCILIIIYLATLTTSYANSDLMLTINKQGFDVLSNNIYSEHLKPIKNKKMSGINTTVDYGIKITSSPLSFSATFTDL